MKIASGLFSVRVRYPNFYKVVSGLFSVRELNIFFRLNNDVCG